MPQLAQREVHVSGRPEDYCIQYQTEGAELVLLAFAVALSELATLAVEDLAGEPVALLMDVDLGAHAAAIALVVDDRKQVQRLRDAAVMLEGLAEPPRLAVPAQHPDQIAATM